MFANQKQLRVQKVCGDQPGKIKKISELINRNVCMKKQIHLNDVTRDVQNVRSARKKKLDVSLSKEKQEKHRSISERSANKSTKLKLSVNKHDSIRKIKSFEISQQLNENIKRIKTPRLIQDLHNCHIPLNKENKNIVNVGEMHGFQGQKRKIRIHRNK